MSTLDTRDLYTELSDLRDRADDPDQADPLDTEENERLNALTGLFDEIGEEAGRDGAEMIPEWDFTRYAEQLADDIGAIDSDAGWPLTHIDWEAAANALSIDYTSVEFDGDTYLVRL